jgi:hypothetical protein
MSILDNIGKDLDKSFENHSYLPQTLLLEDLDQGIVDFLKNLNISVDTEDGIKRPVPLIFLAQELWAEKKMNWKSFRNENGEELTRPFMAIGRTGVKKGSSPLKYTIPQKKKFKFLKVPVFDGTIKGYDLYKIPQPTYIDIEYELRFVTHYILDVNEFYQTFLKNGYSNGEGYLKVNGYHITSLAGDPSEDNTEDDIKDEKIFQIVVPITVHGKLIDPTEFERVNTITKISINIFEKRK